MSQAQTASQYFFTAIATDGRRRRGFRAATNESALASNLSEEGMLLLSSRRLPEWTSRSTTLSVKDQAAFNMQLSSMLTRGVPLVEALEVAGTVVSKGGSAKVERIRKLVQAGASFADACGQVGAFDPIAVAVYRAAERTGELGDAAKTISSWLERRRAINTKAITLLIYPIIVVTISLVISVVVLTLVVPSIGEALRDAGQELPLITELVVGLGVWTRANLPAMLLGAAMLGVIIFILREQIGRALGLVFKRIPAVAQLSLAIESARFFSVMGAMTRTGVPLADALAVATRAVSHPRLRAQLESLQRRLVEGGLLRTLIEQADALPLATRRLLIAAERSGDLDSAFEGLAEEMAAEVDTRAERLLAALEPILIFAMFVVIGSLLMSIMVPLISLTSGAQI